MRYISQNYTKIIKKSRKNPKIEPENAKYKLKFIF